MKRQMKIPSRELSLLGIYFSPVLLKEYIVNVRDIIEEGLNAQLIIILIQSCPSSLFALASILMPFILYNFNAILRLILLIIML